MQLCVDFRKPDKKLLKIIFPLPFIDDILDQLNQAVVFTTLDLKNGFVHVDVNPQSIKYTTFITYDGKLEFLTVTKSCLDYAAALPYSQDT